MINEDNNNAEKIIMGLDELIKDIDSFPNGEIKRLIMAGAVTDVDTKEKLGIDYNLTKTVKIKVGKLNIFKMEV